MTKFSDLREHFLLAKGEAGLSPRTLQLYRGDLSSFETWFERTYQGSPDPLSVLRSDVRGWQEEMRDSFRPATINRRLTSLRQFFAWAERQGLLSRNPVSGIRGLAYRDQGKRTDSLLLTKAHLEKILLEVRRQGDGRDRAMLELLCDAGLRPHELCALTVADYTREASAAWLRIRPASGARTVPLAVRVRTAMDEYLETRTHAPRSSPLFLSRKKQAVTPFVVWHRLRIYADRAGIPEVNPQAVRKAVVRQYLIQTRGDLLAAAERFGEGDLNRLGKLLKSANNESTGKGDA